MNPPITSSKNSLSIRKDFGTPVLSLKIAQINLQKSKAATAELISYLLTNNYTMAGIQDCYIQNGRPYGLPSTLPFYRSISSNAFIIILDTSVKPIMIKQNDHSVFVNIEVGEKTITVGSIYTPPSADLVQDLRDIQMKTGFSKHQLYLGDLNAHSKLWGYARDDDRGHHLITHMATERLIILNDPHCAPTFQTQHLSGWPDVTLSTFDLFPHIKSWSVEKDLQFADHRLITIETYLEYETLPKRRYRTKGVSLIKFGKVLTNQLNQSHITFKSINDSTGFDAEYEQFLTAITTACNQTFKKRKSTHKPRITWWNDKLRIARNYVRALYRKTKLQTAIPEDILKYKSERAKYKKMILDSKRTSWLNFCQKAKDPYGKIKKVAFQDFYCQQIYALANSSALTITQKNYFKDLTRTIFGPSSMPPPSHYTPSDSEPAFTENELRLAIYSFHKHKAPGRDNIDHIITRKIFTDQPHLLLTMYNSLLRINYFPREWKVGELVYFLKGNKDPTQATSYRPISLLPIFGKIFEKLLLRRLQHKIHHSTWLLPNQHGFQENRSIETAIADLFSKIEILKQSEKYITLLSVDFGNAFDSLPWQETKDELRKLKTGQAFENLVGSFLSMRGALPHWSQDEIHWFSKGCPQGSCFGPFLWRVFLNGLLRRLRNIGIAVIAYADDILLVIGGKTRKALEDIGNKALQAISIWADEVRVSISHSKCFSLQLSKPKYLKRPPTYKIQGKSIKSVKNLEYLGVTIDSTLSFLPHLRAKREEIQHTTQNLLKFASVHGSVSREILKIWYRTILEKKITYAASCWFPRMQPSHGRKLLTSIQYQCLLLVSRAYRKTSTLALNTLTGIPPLYLQLQKTAKLGQILRLGIPVDNHVPSMYQVKSKTSSLSFHKPAISILENKREPTSIEIYTDGSKTDQGTGCAFCAYKDKQVIFTKQFKLNTENSVYQAELLAIQEAVNWTTLQKEQLFTIYTDSQSGIKALQDLNTKDFQVQTIIKTIQETSKSIKFAWVRGHIGIEGNELADKLANAATASIENNIYKFHPFPSSYLKSLLHKDLLKSWQNEWDIAEVGRFTYHLQPKVSEKFILHHRNLYLFYTNHGPFPQYLNKIGKSPSANCICGKTGSSLHYILNCDLTSYYRIRKPQNMNLSNWSLHVLSRPFLQQKIINCVQLIEKNQYIFQQVTPQDDENPLLDFNE